MGLGHAVVLVSTLWAPVIQTSNSIILNNYLMRHLIPARLALHITSVPLCALHLWHRTKGAEAAVAGLLHAE